MCMLDRRLQVLLDEKQYARLVAYAAEQGLSVGAAVRDAIDKAIPAVKASRRAAAQRILDAEAMAVPDVPELLEELAALRGRRA